MRKAVLMTLGAIVSVQIGSGFAKGAFPVAGALTMAWLRLTMGTLLLLIIVRPRLRGHTRQDWLILLGYAATLVTMNITFYQAVERIPIGLAVTIEFLGPLAVAVAKSRGVRDLLWVVLAGAGVSLLGVSPGSLTWAGVGFALAAAACWAGYILFSPPVGRRWSGAQPVVLANMAGSLTLLIPVLTWHAEVLTQPWIWLVGLGVGLLSSALPYVLELSALRTLDQRIFSILMSIEPAMGTLAALIILGERLTPTDLVAMACVIAASVGVTWTAGRTRPTSGSGLAGGPPG